MLDHIQQILNPYFAENCKGTIFDLREDAPEALCEFARFRNDTGRVLVYKFDKAQKSGDNTIFPFFANGVSDLKKMCDFILFYENKNRKNFVLLCNLKSNAKGTDSKQMEAAAVFVDFILKTAERLYGNAIVFEPKKYVHFSSNKNRMQKNTVNTRRNSDNLKKQTEFWFYSTRTQFETCNLEQIC